MKFAPRGRRFRAWLALVSLVLQIGFATAHAARHFDHLVGPLGTANPAIAAGELHRTPAAPPPDGPATPGLDHCAIGLGLAAAGSVVLADAGLVPLPP